MPDRSTTQPSKSTILVADNDPATLDILLEASEAKAKIIHTQKGKNALRYLKENTPDMVFAGEDLIGLTGRHVINAMRFTKHLKEVTAVLLTNSSPSEADLEFDFADKIIIKPLDIASLKGFVEVTLKEQAIRKGIIPEPDISGDLTKRILVVEDSETIATLLERVLEREGFQVTAASTLSQAKSLLEANPEQFHLALLDINLPGGSGLDLLKIIAESSDLPSIVLSALQKQSSVEESLALGAKEFIPKPFNPKDLVSRIKEYVA